jgi:hypothetical protein
MGNRARSRSVVAWRRELKPTGGIQCAAFMVGEQQARGEPLRRICLVYVTTVATDKLPPIREVKKHLPRNKVHACDPALPRRTKPRRRRRAAASCPCRRPHFRPRADSEDTGVVLPVGGTVTGVANCDKG